MNQFLVSLLTEEKKQNLNILEQVDFKGYLKNLTMTRVLCEVSDQEELTKKPMCFS